MVSSCSFYILAVHPELQDLKHSLDIWHKAKSHSKKLHQAAKEKNATGMNEWIDSIVNLFWYACENSNGDAEKLKDVWFGVIHHVCDEHVWAESACNHGPLTELEPKILWQQKKLEL